eukprot:UN07414
MYWTFGFWIKFIILKVIVKKLIQSIAINIVFVSINSVDSCVFRVMIYNAFFCWSS